MTARIWKIRGRLLMMHQILMEADHVIGVKVSGKIEFQDMDAMIEVMKKYKTLYQNFSLSLLSLT